MGKDLKGNDIGKGYSQRKDGRYCFNYTDYGHIRQNIKTVYIITDGKYCKVGFTNDVKERLRKLQTGQPCQLEVLKTFTTENAIELEGFLHLIFASKKVNGEWFDILDLFNRKGNCANFTNLRVVNE